MEELFEVMQAVESYNVALSRMLNEFTHEMSMLLMEVAEYETIRTNH